MNSNQFQTYAKSQATKSINQANINATKLKGIEIPISDGLKEQKKYISKLLSCENKIKESQDLINGISKRKEEVIKHFLMNDSSKIEDLEIAAEPKVEYEKQK